MIIDGLDISDKPGERNAFERGMVRGFNAGYVAGIGDYTAALEPVIIAAKKIIAEQAERRKENDLKPDKNVEKSSGA